MSKLLYEVEFKSGKDRDDFDYLYVEADSDISISIGYVGSSQLVTHVTLIDKDIGVEPDLIISKEI